MRRTDLKVSPRWFWPVFVFLTTQLIYLHTLNPAFANDDSAETITASVILGLQHPPGYALAAVLGRFLSLLPLGNFSFRANWGASLWASLDAALLTLLIISLLRNLFLSHSSVFKEQFINFCGVWGGLSLAAATVFWDNALSAKGGVYLLGVCFQLLVFLCLAIGQEGKTKISRNVLTLSFFLTGLGLSNHWETLVLFVPALFIFLFLNGNLKISGWIQGCTFSVLGASVLIFLSLRAHLNPVLNLGEPDTISNFWADIFRTYVSFREVSLWGSFVGLLKGSIQPSQFLIFFNQLLKNKVHLFLVNLGLEIGWFSFGLAIIGMAVWLRSANKKILFFLLLSCFLIWGSIFSYYDKVENVNTPLYMIKFFLSTNWILILLASLGLYFLLSKLLDWKKMAGIFAAALIMIGLMMNIQNGLKTAERKNRLVLYDYGQNLLKSLPPYSLFFADADEDYFSLYYLQQVEHHRPDVVMIPAFTLFESWGTKKVEKEEPDLGLTASSMLFPDHFARIIYSSSELVFKNRNQRPIGFSNFGGAFHRYYLDRQKGIKIRRSGVAWLLDYPPARRMAGLNSYQLRFRERPQVENRFYGSFDSIFKIYDLVGLDLSKN